MAVDLTAEQNIAQDQVAYYTQMLNAAQSALDTVNAQIAAQTPPAT